MRGAFQVKTTSGMFVFGDQRLDLFGLRSITPPESAVALQTSRPEVVVAALEGLQGWAREVHLLPPDVDRNSLPPGVLPIEPGDFATLGGDELRDIDTTWVVYTSGTTGAPKAIRHSRSSLTRTISASGHTKSLTWGLLYDPNRMAGLQVLHHALATGATVVAPATSLPIVDRIRFLASNGVTALSATPTLWRMVLQVRLAQPWNLRQITLGGEIADQRILDALASRFPGARIVHIFASTETGAAFSVSDGREGFPASFLEQPPRGVRLEIRDDMLFVHSPGVSVAGADGFAATGDVVELIDDRVFFRGRQSGVVNIGGANVWPEEVEKLLREHPEVMEARVGAVANAMTGHLLMAKVVPTPEAHVDDLGKRLRSWIRGRAPGAHVPARVTVVEELEIMATGKAMR